MGKTQRNLDPRLQSKIMRWQESGVDEVVSGFIRIRNAQVVDEIRKKNIIPITIVGDTHTFHDVSVSKLKEISDIKGVDYIELSRKLRPS